MKRIALAVLLVLVLAGDSRSDTFVMKNGSVIEGKFKSYDPVAKTFVIEIDEKGTLKTLKEKDLEKRFAGKTTWERRAEYLKEYEKSKKPTVKPTWESNQSMGKWCKAHLLVDKSKEHYQAARRLRVEKLVADLEAGRTRPEQEIDERLKLAKWCEKDLGLFPEAEEERRIAYGVKRILLGEESTAELHFTLGKWSEQQGLEDEAVAAYDQAVALNPKHSGAKSALDRIRNSLDFKLKLMAAEFDKAKRAQHITVTIEENVDKKFLEEWQEKMQFLSDYIWNITEGQFYIVDCEIEDNVSDGRIIVEKGKLDWYGMDNKEGNGVLAYCAASGTPAWEIHCPGKSGVSVLCHEMFHGIYGLPDEYYQDPMCECVMKSAPNPQKLCDDRNHIGGSNREGPPGSAGKTCWQIITGRPEFKGTPRHPNPDWVWAKPPDAKGDLPMGPPQGMKDTRTEGPRNPGGELRWNGLRIQQAPKTVFHLIDN